MAITPRTTEGAVKDILKPGGDYDTVNNPPLLGPMQSAKLLVDRVVICAAKKGITYDADTKELMERYLAAHAYCLSDQTYASKTTSGASMSAHGQTGKSIESTRYGQMAIDLDYSGCLAALMLRARAGGAWLGKPRSQQVPYDQRD